jgi:glycosyltransferase involved in cell wall biosynthesis
MDVHKNILKFSIITVNKNNGKGLRKTLQSIEMQTETDYEVIVIDGNSNDDSSEVIAEFNGLICRFEIENHLGVYAAMNQGVNLARGEWSIFMNSGDYFYSSGVLKEFAPKSTSQLAYGRAWIEGASGPAKYNGLPNIWRGQPFCHQALFTKTEILREIPFDTSLSIVADYKFLVQAFLKQMNFEGLGQDICWIEPPGMSGKQVVRRLLEKYRVAKRAFPDKPLLRNSIKQYYLHCSAVMKTRLRGQSGGR